MSAITMQSTNSILKIVYALTVKNKIQKIKLPGFRISYFRK